MLPGRATIPLENGGEGPGIGRAVGQFDKLICPVEREHITEQRVVEDGGAILKQAVKSVVIVARIHLKMIGGLPVVGENRPAVRGP